MRYCLDAFEYFGGIVIEVYERPVLMRYIFPL